MEKTLIIAKPDAVQRGLVGEIIRRLELKGLKLIGIKMLSLSSELLQAHYEEHLERFLQRSGGVHEELAGRSHGWRVTSVSTPYDISSALPIPGKPMLAP